MAEPGTFYEYVMAGEPTLAAARSVDGFTEEIALLRASLRAEAQLRFGNLPALIRGAEAVAKLVTAQERLIRSAPEDPWAGYHEVAEEIRQTMEMARPQCAHCPLPTANAKDYTEGENGRGPQA